MGRRCGLKRRPFYFMFKLNYFSDKRSAKVDLIVRLRTMSCGRSGLKHLLSISFLTGLNTYNRCFINVGLD